MVDRQNNNEVIKKEIGMIDFSTKISKFRTVLVQSSSIEMSDPDK